MPFQSHKEPLRLTEEESKRLHSLSHSRTGPVQRVERARMLLRYAAGESVSAIARKLKTNRPKVYRCIDKALELGVEAALRDLPGRGKKAAITPEARAWVTSLACQKPKELGYAQELWTMRLLAQHVRQNCREAGHPSLSRMGRGTASKILSQAALRPHKVRYYVEKRDAEFEAKMAEVLCVYRQVRMLRQAGEEEQQAVVILSYDEKPGIQAIESTGRELPPVPGQHEGWLRDYEYVRHGTLSLLAGIDLLSGHVHSLVAPRHRSREFVQFLQLVDGHYPEQARIRVILDNHSAHVSKETRAYLATRPNRFDFVFTPKHGSWLNLIETFFAKTTRVFLRGMRVSSREELKRRLEQYLEEVNQSPVVFRWKYGLDEPSMG